MASMRPLSFAELLRRYRVAAGLTQEELAEKAQVSKRGIGALETGERSAPQQATLERLATALALSDTQRSHFKAVARQRAPASPPAPHGAPASAAARLHSSPFVGRATELAALDRHVAGDGAPLLTLTGEPGIGKSRLLAMTAARASAAGWMILSGGCHARSSQEPYAPFVGALARFLATRSAAQQRLDLQGCAWLVRLLPELAESEVGPAPAWTLPPEQERRLMFAAVARLLANVSGPAGTLLILDDLHWAGEDALALLSTLLREPGTSPVRIVGAYRDTDVARSDPLPFLLGELAHEGLAAQLPLPLLSPDEARELLVALLADEATRTGDSEGDSNAQIGAALQRAGGLPLFVVSWTQEVRAGAGSAEGAHPTVPWSAAESLRQRVAVLPADAQFLLAVAAVAGRETPRAQLMATCAVSGLDERRIIGGIEAACHARLLAETAEGAYRFTHDLVQETVLADLSGARRVVLHRQVAAILERQPQQEWHVAQLAWHFTQGDEPAKAMLYALQAGDQAEGLYAHADAEQQYDMAARLAHALGDRVNEARALEGLGKALTDLGRMGDAVDALERAAELRKELGDLDHWTWDIAKTTRAYSLLGQSHVGLARLEATLTSLAVRAEQSPEGVAGGIEQFQSAPRAASLAETLETTAMRAASLLSPRVAGRMYLSLTIHLSFLERFQEALRMGEQAVERTRVAGDGPNHATAQAFLGKTLVHLGQISPAITAYEAARETSEAARHLDGLFLAYSNLGEIHLNRGEFASATQAFLSSLSAAEQCGPPDSIGETLACLGEIAFYTGEWLQTLDYCERASAVLGAYSHGSVPMWASLLRGRVCLSEGQTPKANAYLAEAMALGERTAQAHLLRVARAAPAEAELLAGHALEARQRLVPLVEQSAGSVQKVLWLLPWLAWAQVNVGEMDQAAATLEECIALATAQEDHLVLVDALRIKALLATRRNAWQEAEDALEESLALARPMPYPYAEAKALWVYGNVEVAREHLTAARARLEQALAICERLGEGLYRPHIERELWRLAQKI
jgi:tetratricopeptide (TPR) repeat protein/transcriptional regulator with XRE-family HTH domain